MSPTSPRLPAARHQATTNTAPPFKLHRGSHLIHKHPPSAAGSSSSSSNSSVTSSSGSVLTTTDNGAAHRPPPCQHKQTQQQQPVIIYTHSPKVIRTNPRDFMSIVQKLTGLESSVAARAAGVCPPGTTANKEAGSTATSQEESSSSTDSCANQAHIAALPPSYVDPQQMLRPLGTHFMPPEIPLCAPRGLYGGPFAPVVSSANMKGGGGGGGTVFSPGVAFPDH